MRCDLCKHWDRKERLPHGLGECFKAPVFWDASEWVDDPSGATHYNIYLKRDVPDQIRRLKPEHSNTKMFVQDGSDYQAYLFTMPDFFCAHYEEKKGATS